MHVKYGQHCRRCKDAETKLFAETTTCQALTNSRIWLHQVPAYVHDSAGVR